MFKKCWLCLSLLTVPLIITGCWDSTDIEMVKFPTFLAYDIHKTEENSENLAHNEQIIDVTTLAPNLSQNSIDVASTLTISAATIGETRSLRGNKVAEKYSPHFVQMLIIGEDLARSDCMRKIDMLYRDPQVANYINLAVAEGRGEDILKTPTENFGHIGNFMENLIPLASEKGFIPVVTLHDFETSQGLGGNPVVPLIKKTADDKVAITGTAVFAKDRLLQKLDREQTRTLVLLRGMKSTGLIPFVLKKDGEVVDQGVASLANKRKVKASREGEKVILNIKIELNGVLEERSRRINLRENREENLKEIEGQIEQDIQNECEAFILYMQNTLQVDCLDLTRYALAKWRKELTPAVLHKNFISNAEIRVEVDVHLKNLGEISSWG